MDMFDVMLGSKLGGGGGGEAANYNDLSGLPQINGVELKGNKSTAQLLISFTASDVGALPDSTKYAAAVSLSIDQSTYVVTAQLKDQDGNNIGAASTVDLPLETMVVGGSYDAQNQKIVLTLKDGNTTDIAIGALISGLQPELVPGTNLDTTPTSGSTNPVTSGGVWTPLAYLVDSGAKNRLTVNSLDMLKTQNTGGTWTGNVYEYRGVTYTVNADYTISATGKAEGGNANLILSPVGGFTIESGQWVLSGCPAGGSASTYNISIAGTASDIGNTGAFTSCTSVLVRIYIIDGTSVNDLTFRPMVCAKAAWDISHAYEPYCPTMAELYAMIQALQSGTRSVQMRTEPDETSGEEER